MGRKKKQSALAVKDEEKEIANIRPTKADLFVDAFIRHRFNASAAALEVFDITSDDEAKKKATAGSIGHEYLNKPQVQEKLRERMSRQDVSVEWVISRLKAMGEKTDNDDVGLRVLDRLAHFVGAPIKESSTDVSRGRNPQLALYMHLPPPAKQVDERIIVQPERG